MTPVILAIAAGVVLVIGVGIMIAVRSRGEDEGARFRHVADITSTWSRQSGDSDPSSHQSGDSETSSHQSGGQETSRETGRPLPYPDTNATPSAPESEPKATASGRPRASGR